MCIRLSVTLIDDHGQEIGNELCMISDPGHSVVIREQRHSTHAFSEFATCNLTVKRLHACLFLLTLGVYIHVSSSKQ